MHERRFARQKQGGLGAKRQRILTGLCGCRLRGRYQQRRVPKRQRRRNMAFMRGGQAKGRNRAFAPLQRREQARKIRCGKQELEYRLVLPFRYAGPPSCFLLYFACASFKRPSSHSIAASAAFS